MDGRIKTAGDVLAAIFPKETMTLGVRLGGGRTVSMISGTYGDMISCLAAQVDFIAKKTKTAKSLVIMALAKEVDEMEVVKHGTYGEIAGDSDEAERAEDAD